MNKAKKATKNAGTFINSMFVLSVTIAQASAAYVLWFQQNHFMQAIAVVLSVQAAITAVDKFNK